MEQIQSQSPTFESVWASLQETDRMLKESSADFDRRMKESDQQRKKSRADFDRSLKKSRADFDRSLKKSRADFDRRMKESDKRREESNADFDRRMKEADQQRKESKADFDRRMKEADQQREESNADFDRRMKEADQQRKESNTDFDRRMKEAEQQRKESKADFDLSMKEAAKRMKKLEELTGSWTNNHGSFAEEYFFNSFDNGKQNFFGEQFDHIMKQVSNYWQGLKDEYDIVLYNHTSVALVEVKYKAHENDIPTVLKKSETFRLLFPQYKDFKIYLGLASMSFYPKLENECVNKGIAVIKQVGDTVVINDAHLKVF